LYGRRRIARAITERGGPTHEHESFSVDPHFKRNEDASANEIKREFRGTELPRIEGKNGKQRGGHIYPFF
jgi:hypothetical protein